MMKVLIAGVQEIKGTSKAGSPFAMCNVITLVPVENVSNIKVQIRGFGLKTMEMACDPLCIGDFSGINEPVQYEITVEPRPYMGKYEMTVVSGKRLQVSQPRASA